MATARRWPAPSLEGRRLSLERKFRHNVGAYSGEVMLVTLTAPGQDVLPWGDDGFVEELPYRLVWNATAQARASRLYEAGQKAADRWLLRQGYKGPLPRQICGVRADQKRGVFHFHWLLPAGSPLEAQWSRIVFSFMDRAWRRDIQRWPTVAERWELLWGEFAGTVTPGFYGFGFAHKGRKRGAGAASYMARNAAGYMATNASGRSRHYVSTRLTRQTGVTMRNLRSCNWLFVRQGMIRRGELREDEWIPWSWDADRRAEVVRVWALVQAAPAQAP